MKISILISIILCLSCFSYGQTALIVLEDGIYKETFDKTNTSPDRFTADNIIYTPGRIFTYSYQFLRKGEQYFFEVKNAQAGPIPEWALIPVSEKDDNSHYRISPDCDAGLAGF